MDQKTCFMRIFWIFWSPLPMLRKKFAKQDLNCFLAASVCVPVCLCVGTFNTFWLCVWLLRNAFLYIFIYKTLFFSWCQNWQEQRLWSIWVQRLVNMEERQIHLNFQKGAFFCQSFSSFLCKWIWIFSSVSFCLPHGRARVDVPALQNICIEGCHNLVRSLIHKYLMHYFEKLIRPNL